MGRPEWSLTPEFETAEARSQNILSLHERISEWTSGCDKHELTQRLQAAGVTAAPVLGVAELLGDPHFKARDTFIEVDHPLGYSETIYGAYIKMSRSRPIIKPGPYIGQDNDTVFRDILGLPEERYQALIESQVIY